MPIQSRNYLLSALPPDESEVIAPRLRAFEMVRGNTLVAAGDPLEYVYFPDEGMISLVIHLKSGGSVESVVIGRDGLLGTSASGASPPSQVEAIVQIAGPAHRMGVQAFREVYGQCPAFRNLATRYGDFVTVQAQQSAACNIMHEIPERLARWLLKSRDLVAGDTLPLTQEFLSHMLGVRRASVTTAAQTLEAAGLIDYGRGRIKILNVDGLRESACECYQTVKNHYNFLFPGAARDHLEVVRTDP
jgi:CRP-like cAMP-binding protein